MDIVWQTEVCVSFCFKSFYNINMRVRNQKKREFRFVFGSCVLFGVLLCAGIKNYCWVIALMNMVNDFNNGNFNGRMLESNDTDDNSTTCGEDIQV